MEYENAEKAIQYRTACENVKKIVNAIKFFKIKYYLDFSKISEDDEKKYRQLNIDLERITEENNLGNLKTALMSEVSAKYDRNNSGNEQGEPQATDDRLLACYGAIDVQKKALSEGKLKKAIKCQKLLEEYLEKIDVASYKELVVNYKREKFGELIRKKEVVHENNEQWNEKMKNCCKIEFAKDREYAMNQIQKARESTITLFRSTNEQKLIQGVVSRVQETNDTNEIEVG